MDIKKQEIQALIQRRELWRQGKLTTEQLLTEVATSKTLFNWVHLDYKVTMQEANPQRRRKALTQRGLVGDGTLIDVTPEDAANESVYCEDQNKVITRADCKAHSGNPEYMDQCRECDIDKSTRCLVTQRLEGRAF